MKDRRILIRLLFAEASCFLCTSLARIPGCVNTTKVSLARQIPIALSWHLEGILSMHSIEIRPMITLCLLNIYSYTFLVFTSRRIPWQLCILMCIIRKLFRHLIADTVLAVLLQRPWVAIQSITYCYAHLMTLHITRSTLKAFMVNTK